MLSVNEWIIQGNRRQVVSVDGLYIVTQFMVNGGVCSVWRVWGGRPSVRQLRAASTYLLRLGCLMWYDKHSNETKVADSNGIVRTLDTVLHFNSLGEFNDPWEE